LIENGIFEMVRRKKTLDVFLVHHNIIGKTMKVEFTHARGG